MNADDIAGLTAAEIQDKFSIPGNSPPTHICEVTVPNGTELEISSANGILGHSGGGVQYRIRGELHDSMFDNVREIK